MAIEIIKGDITKLAVGAIVNSANKTLLGGGGVDGAIHRAGGLGVLVECKELGGCKTGEAKLTHGCNLPVKHVIHTVGPVYGEEHGNEDELLANCYINSLKLAEEKNIRTIAFPSISTGSYHFPIEQAAPIAIKTVQDYVERHPGAFDQILFVLHSDNDYKIYQKEMEYSLEKKKGHGG